MMEHFNKLMLNVLWEIVHTALSQTPGLMLHPLLHLWNRRIPDTRAPHFAQATRIDYLVQPKGKSSWDLPKDKKKTEWKEPTHTYHAARWTLRFVGQKLADTKGTIWKKEIQNSEHYSKCSSTSFIVYFLIVQYMQAIPQHTNIENTPFLQGIEIITVAKEALFYANVFQHRISAPLSKANVCFPLFPSARNPSPAPAQQCVHCSLPQHTECLTWLMLTPSIFLHSPRQTHSPLCPSSSAPFPNNTNLGLREEAKKGGETALKCWETA